MPWSNDMNKVWVPDFVAAQTGIQRVLEVGVGFGDMGKSLRDRFPELHLRGIEVWEPYLRDPRFVRPSPYDEGIRVADVREAEDGWWDEIDLTIWIDGPEHLELGEAQEQLHRLRRLSRIGVLVSTPLGLLPQDAFESNEFERHCSTWTHDTWRCLFPDALRVDGDHQTECRWLPPESQA